SSAACPRPPSASPCRHNPAPGQSACCASCPDSSSSSSPVLSSPPPHGGGGRAAIYAQPLRGVNLTHRADRTLTLDKPAVFRRPGDGAPVRSHHSAALLPAGSGSGVRSVTNSSAAVGWIATVSS